MNNYLRNFIENVIKESKHLSFLNKGEEATRQGIILPILDNLDWPIYEIDNVVPEYSSGNGKVDYCLKIKGEEKCFIEVKRANENLLTHQEQLLNYSFRNGVELAILTNGYSWWFYLPLSPGKWKESRFLKLNLKEDDIEKSVKLFERYLSYSEIENGDSIKNAKELHESKKIESITNAAIPEAFDSILKNSNELVRLINDKVIEICGHEPFEKDIEDFLESIPTLTSQEIDYDNDTTKSASTNYSKTSSNNINSKTSVNLKNLIEFGILKPGDIIFCNYKRERYEAEILDDCKIKTLKDDKIINSLSTAARNITNSSRNGWTFWNYENNKGEVVTLDELRETLLKRKSNNNEEVKVEAQKNNISTKNNIHNISVSDFKNSNKRELLNGTEVVESYFGNKSSFNWRDLLRKALKSISEDNNKDELIKELTDVGGFIKGKNDKSNWKYYSELGISYSRMDTGMLCDKLLFIAQMLNTHLIIHFRWKDAPGKSKYPGEEGEIDWDFSK